MRKLSIDLCESLILNHKKNKSTYSKHKYDENISNYVEIE